jgi:toxin secretion/phage lysis holin
LYDKVIPWFGALGTALTYAFGGWDKAIYILVVFMVADYITGVVAAFKQKKVDSDVMYWGLLRKGGIMLVIAIAVMLDMLVNAEHPIFRTLVIYLYVAREGLSLVENLGKWGVYVPPFLANVLEQMKDKAEQDQDNIKGDDSK